MDYAKQFLDGLFGGKSDEEFILIWLLDGRRSAWFKDTAAAAAFVEANKARDVYVGVALSPADHGPHLRLKIEGGERMPTSIVALWADIDIADAVHKKKNLAPTVGAARSVLFPEFPPSILLHSGGGLQAWWNLKEPWTLDSDAEARKAGALATRWIRAIRARAAAKGWDIDSVGDLTRVLRVPGTSNCKIPGQPRPVQIIEINDRRYNPSDLDEYLDLIGAERVSTKVAQVTTGEKLQYSSAAEPPFQRFQTLCDVEPKFKASWEHLRKDLQDQSASSYDMALANFTVQAGWTDQEIANLLIAHRRRCNEDLKLRDSYYLKTISKARVAFADVEAMKAIDELISPSPAPDRDADGEKATPAPSTADPAQQKAALVAQINTILHMGEERRIICIWRYTSEPFEYELHTVSGDIHLGAVEVLSDWYRFYNKVFDLTAHQIPEFKKGEWRKVSKMLRDACIDVSVGDESTDAGMVNGWLRSYLVTKSKTIMDSIEAADKTREPFLAAGRIHIYMSDFRRSVQLSSGDRIPPKKMGTLLRRAGAVDKRFTIGKSSRQVWVLAESFTPPSQTEPPSWVTDEQPEEVIQ